MSTYAEYNDQTAPKTAIEKALSGFVKALPALRVVGSRSADILVWLWTELLDTGDPQTWRLLQVRAHGPRGDL